MHMGQLTCITSDASTHIGARVYTPNACILWDLELAVWEKLKKKNIDRAYARSRLKPFRPSTSHPEGRTWLHNVH